MAQTLPRGAGIVFRHFGAADAEARGRRLKAIARRRGLVLLIGADVDLARRLDADGVHLPERNLTRAGPLRRIRPDWIVTCAAHSVRAARQADADAVVMSTAFPSRSPSAGRALGPLRLALRARAAGRPAYALGGITQRNAPRLLATGIVGLAAVDGLRT